MKVPETKTASVASPSLNVQSFFRKNSGNMFASLSETTAQPAFFFSSKLNAPILQTKLTIGQPGDIYEKEADAVAEKVVSASVPALQTQCAECETEENLHKQAFPEEEELRRQPANDRIQRQEQPDGPAVRDVLSPTPKSEGGATRASRCYTDPEFPDFRCLAYALKLDIDENLWNNAHHFYRVASLYPGDNELMWNTFLRYGLGVNLLQTGFGFLGTDKTLGSVLSYGTGIGLKSYEFFTNGRLELDVPIPLGRGINLDLKLDLNADPDNLTDIQGVQTGVGISGHF